jgi:hypothetical protein
MTDLKKRGITVTESDKTDMDNSKKAVKTYITKLCKNLRSRFDGKAMGFLRTYSLFRPSEQSAAKNDEDIIKSIFCDDPSALLCELPVFRRWVDTKPTASATEVMVQIATGPERAVFPAFSALAIKLLVTPIGTASVERSFSNLNCIITDKRNRLLPINQDCLLRLFSEGPDEPDQEFLETVYTEWAKQSHRFSE